MTRDEEAKLKAELKEKEQEYQNTIRLKDEELSHIQMDLQKLKEVEKEKEDIT